VPKKGRRGRLPDSRPEAGATFNRRYIRNVGVTFGNFLTGILVPKKGLELEAPRRRERSGSLLPKSRAQRGTSLASNLHWNLGAEEGTRTPTPLRVHGPEPCASANSATSARVEASEILAGQEAKLLYRWDAEIRNELSALSSQLSAVSYRQRRTADPSAALGMTNHGVLRDTEANSGEVMTES
jgi:hypothetical protein